MMKREHLLALVCSLTLLAGCGRAAPDQPAAPAEPVAMTPVPAAPAALPATATPASPLATPVAAAPAAADAPALDPTALCPPATADTVLYISTENGFCALYPASLTEQVDTAQPEEVVHWIGAPADPNAMESAAVILTVAYNGPADAVDSAQYAETWVGLNVPGMTLPQEPATIGGQPAVIVNDLPGMGPQRGAFVIANGIKYLITVQPAPEIIPELTAEATLAWDTLTQSIVFFPPQNTRPVVRAADVCPAETADGKLAINLIYGYCYLYPTDFAPDPEFPVAVKGGPDLGSFEGFEHVRVSLTVASYPLAGMTAEQVMQPPTEQTDPASVTQTTIGGYPALSYDFTGGPWRQRNTLILVDDTVYTFVAQPWDADLFPQALPDVERVWDMAVASIAFFDPWH